MRYFITVLSLLLSFQVSGQNYERAIVTDLNFLLRTANNVDNERFPFYFQETDFIKDIQTEISYQLTKRFSVNDVLFLNALSIQYHMAGSAVKTEAQDFAILTKRPSTLYVSVESIIQEYAVLNNEQVYRFSTRVNVYDTTGKNIYKFKNHIPFVSYYGDEIAGAAEMSEYDFYTFYFDGIAFAFEGREKVVDKRYIAKPTAEKFKSFADSSERFYLATKAKGYNYGQDRENLSEIISFPVNHWKTESGVFEFENLVTRETLDKGYTFKNNFNNQKYTVKLKGGVGALRAKYDPNDDFTLQLFNDKGRYTGYLNYKGVELLYGHYNDWGVRFEWKPEYNCFDVYLKGKRLALINHLDYEKVLFLRPDISRYELTSLLNLIFTLDYALAIRQRMYQVYYN